jgi:hypothetical protein
MGLARELLGRGGWRAWHFFTLAWIVPLALSVRAALAMTPGAGPQGGEAVFLLMFLGVLGLAFCSVVNATLWLATRGRVGVLGRIRRFALVSLATVAGLALWFRLLVHATAPDGTDGFDAAAWAGVIALLAGAFAFNLWALVRRARTTGS